MAGPDSRMFPEPTGHKAAPAPAPPAAALSLPQQLCKEIRNTLPQGRLGILVTLNLSLRAPFDIPARFGRFPGLQRSGPHVDFEAP